MDTDTRDVPKESQDNPTPSAAEKLSPRGIAAMQGEAATEQDLEARDTALQVNTEQRDAMESQLPAAHSDTQEIGAPPSPPEVEQRASSSPKDELPDRSPAFKPGYQAETPPMTEGEPLEEKPIREGPIPPEGWQPGGVEGGG